MRNGLNSRRRTIAAGAIGVVCSVALAACSSGSGSPNASGSKSPVASKRHVSPSSSPTHPRLCPLTGKAPGKGDDPARPALAVKIDNIPPALPQAGLNSADVVIQEEVEGGLTRLFAVFQCSEAPNVGPIRSARTTDADLLALLHGSVFGFSGDNPAVLPPINKYGDTSMVTFDSGNSAFHLDPSREAPHDVFGASINILRAGKHVHKGRIPPPHSMFSYGPLDARAHPVHSASMSWPAASAEWTWQGGQWLRTQDGSPDTLTTGDQVNAANVVVLSVKLKATGIHDVAGSPSPDDLTVGKGRAWVLRDGHYIAGTWSRATPQDEWTLKDRAGQTIDLTPGRTWVELLPDVSTLHFGKK